MLDNSFFKDFNGTFYKYITQDGKIGYVRDVQAISDLISLIKVDNLHLFSNLVDLASIYNVETRVITNGEKVVGGTFTILDSSIIMTSSPASSGGFLKGLWRPQENRGGGFCFIDNRSAQCVLSLVSSPQT